MSEALKTMIFVGSALLIAIVAYATKPQPIPFKQIDQVGKPLFEDFKDPADAASLEIVKFDEDLGTLHPFKVERDKFNRWTIPSHSGYPADAEDQMRDAAVSLLDLKVLGVASEVASEHELLGVVEPKEESLKVGDKGVGMLVEVKDSNGENLAKLVIGKKVRDTEDQHFVRVPPQDVVFTVKIDPDKFTTKFEDWIEKDLLKLSSFDIADVTIKDYSVSNKLVNTPQGPALDFSIDERFDADLHWNADDGKWEVAELTEYAAEGEEPKVIKSPPEGKEVNTEKMNDLKSALDDLEIVDVRRKPDGLTADLKAGEGFVNSNQAVQDLFSRGFLPLRAAGSDEVEIRCVNGEVHVTTKDAVQYVLRFGKITSAEAGDSESETGKVNRYMFVSTRLNPKKLSPPVPEELPELPSAESASQDTSVDAFRDMKNGGLAGGDDIAKESAIESERERIRKENDRKQNEYQEKLKKAQEKVRELNGRFAEWYYVIPDEMYTKIRLNLSDLFKDAEKEENDEGDQNSAS